MNSNTPGFSVHHYLPEFAAHWVNDTIQPSSPLLPPLFSCPQFFPATGSFPMNLLFTSGGQSIKASASVLPMYHTVLETQWAAIWTHHISHIKWITTFCCLDLEFIPSLYSPPFSFSPGPCLFITICSSLSHWTGLLGLSVSRHQGLCSTPMPTSYILAQGFSPRPFISPQFSSLTSLRQACQLLGTTAVCALVCGSHTPVSFSSILGTMHSAWPRASPKFGAEVNEGQQ